MGAFRIITTIVNTIAAEFPAVKIYDETIEQGFQRPCFFVEQVRCEQRPEIYFSAKRDYSVCVAYFSEKKNAFEHSIQIAEKLIDILEFVCFDEQSDCANINSIKRGNNIRYFFKNETLKFEITYTLFAKRKDSDFVMKSIKQNLQA